MTDFEETMRALRASFAAKLPERVNAIVALVPAASDGADASWEALRLDIHRLRGTCANYGFTALGRIMADLDERMIETKDRAARAQLAQEVGERLRAANFDPD